MTSVPINGAGHSGKTITGKETAAWLAHASVVTKLCVAAAIATGELKIVDLTPAQSARLVGGVKSKQVRAMMELSPEQRAALVTKRRVNSIGHLSNEVVDDIVDKVGAARMLSAIDRATMPKSNGLNGNGTHHAA